MCPQKCVTSKCLILHKALPDNDISVNTTSVQNIHWPGGTYVYWPPTFSL